MFTILIALCVHRILCNCPVHKVICILKKVSVCVCTNMRKRLLILVLRRKKLHNKAIKIVYINTSFQIQI